MAITNHRTVTPSKLASAQQATDDLLSAAQAVDKQLSLLEGAYTKLTEMEGKYASACDAIGLHKDTCNRINHDLDNIIKGAVLKVAPAFSVGFNLPENIQRRRQDRVVRAIELRLPEVIREGKADDY